VSTLHVSHSALYSSQFSILNQKHVIYHHWYYQVGKRVSKFRSYWRLILSIRHPQGFLGYYSVIINCMQPSKVSTLNLYHLRKSSQIFKQHTQTYCLDPPLFVLVSYALWPTTRKLQTWKARWDFVQGNGRLAPVLKLSEFFSLSQRWLFFSVPHNAAVFTDPATEPLSVSRPSSSRFCGPVVTTFKNPGLEFKIREVKVNRDVGSTLDRVKGE
jgi:hypothetical protein